MTWEGSGLRIGLAVDSFIFFANVRPNYTWAYCANTVVYTYYKYERKETAMVFWDLTTQEHQTKNISNLKFLCAYGDLCAVVIGEKSGKISSAVAVTAENNTKKLGGNSKLDDDDDEDDEDAKVTQKAAGVAPSVLRVADTVYTVQLRNSVGAVLDSKRLTFTPKHVCIGPMHIVVSNERTVYTWQFQSHVKKAGVATITGARGVLASADVDNDASGGSRDSKGRSDVKHTKTQSRERMFDIESADDRDRTLSTPQPPETFKMVSDAIGDPITCTTISDRYLMVARRSGKVMRFTLPHLTPENIYNFRCEPYKMEFNCISSRLGVIDMQGSFFVVELDVPVTDKKNSKFVGDDEKNDRDDDKEVSETKVDRDDDDKLAVGEMYGRKLAGVEKKDVWDMRWAVDNDEMIAIMEKTKLIVYKHDVAEDPVVASAYIARFKDLEVRGVCLDELLTAPEHPKRYKRILPQQWH